jgi:inner membrane protein involved in colicin E2 resistance
MCFMVLIRRRAEDQDVFDNVQEQFGKDQRIVGPVLHHQINGAWIL